MVTVRDGVMLGIHNGPKIKPKNHIKNLSYETLCTFTNGQIRIVTPSPHLLTT